MRSPEPSSPSTAEALLHGQFASWGSGSNSNNNSCPNSPGGPGGLSPIVSPTPAPASNYALTLTHTHIHIQRLSPRPGKEARLLLPLSELVGCSCPRAPAPPLLVLYWYPPGKRRKGVSRRRQVRAYLAESRSEAERWSAAVQCLLRDVTVTADTDISVVDATTTTSSSSSEFVQRKRPSSASRDAVRLKEAKMEVTSDDCVQVQQHDNMKELFEVMMQSVTSLAASLASSQSSSQPSDQLTPLAQSSLAAAVLQPDLHHLQTQRGPLPSCAASRLNHLKTEEQEAEVAELLDQTDGEEECGAASTRPTRAKRKSGDGLLEECLRRMEAREAQRDRDLDQRDDVTLFLLSLAPAMRRLPAEKQSWVRTKIQQFLHEAEFGATSFQ